MSLLLAALSQSALAAPRAAIAARDLPAGTTLSEADLATVKLKLALPEGALAATDAVGQTLRRPLPAGAILRSSFLADTPPAVASRRDAAVYLSPSGSARVTPLLRGNNAFVALLALDPGAQIPAHRDPTEEYVYLLEGYGLVTINGVEHELSPGSAVFLPALSEVSLSVGERPLLAIQIFADPSPAEKYTSWTATSPLPPSVREGPFDLSCRDTLCAISYQGKPVVEGLSHHPAPVIGAPDPEPHEGLLASMSLFPGFEHAWLVRSDEGDACPSMYRMLCLEEGYPVLTPPFGNCNEYADLSPTRDGALSVQFDALLEGGRSAKVVSLRGAGCRLGP